MSNPPPWLVSLWSDTHQANNRATHTAGPSVLPGAAASAPGLAAGAAVAPASAGVLAFDEGDGLPAVAVIRDMYIRGVDLTPRYFRKLQQAGPLPARASSGGSVAPLRSAAPASAAWSAWKRSKKSQQFFCQFFCLRGLMQTLAGKWPQRANGGGGMLGRKGTEGDYGPRRQ